MIVPVSRTLFKRCEVNIHQEKMFFFVIEFNKCKIFKYEIIVQLM